MPIDRSPTPPAEPVAIVPKKFRALIGEHTAHPGTGLGNAAVGRRKLDEARVA